MRTPLCLPLSVLLLASAAHATDVTSTPFPGATRIQRTLSNQRIQILKVDLCASGIELRTSAQNETGKKTSAWAAQVGAIAAVNGDFSVGLVPDGPAAHAGQAYGGPDVDWISVIGIGPSRVGITHHSDTSGIAGWMREVVSGRPTLLDNGQPYHPFADCPDGAHPRTAIGLTQDERTLILVTVDGRQAGAAGMCIGALAELMHGLGAWDAVNMDGGGSTTMVIGGQIVNTPSDTFTNGSPGRERTVANHLGVMLTPGGPSPQCPSFVAPECGGQPDLESCGGTVITRCEGGTPIANGDCGAFGAGCSTAGGEAHCVHPFCLIGLDGAEDGTFCQDDAVLATCELGVYSEGDCSYFGAACSDEGGAGHCVHPFCLLGLDGGETGTFCHDDGVRVGRCQLGQYEEIDCAAQGTVCTSDGSTAACLGDEPEPPATGTDAGPVADPPVDGTDAGNAPPVEPPTEEPDAGPTPGDGDGDGDGDDEDVTGEGASASSANAPASSCRCVAPVGAEPALAWIVGVVALLAGQRRRRRA